ncbi:MAG: lantibiotic immunity ABC transporter MutE/EpiE family permease subunit [Tissierellia bacterium]|nr:lantibiotic immunity ABC transporter MutE/EpiE family permease subunit [Tissierellia bacterium]
MRAYLLGETLKYRRTLVGKIPLLAPLGTILAALILMPAYFTVNGYNWWYVFLLPGTAALLAGLMVEGEEKSHWGGVHSLDLSFEKLWAAKVAVAGGYLLLAIALHLLGMVLLQGLLPRQLGGNYPPGQLALASGILFLTSLWQLPLCLHLAKSWGLFLTVMVHSALSFLLGIFTWDGALGPLLPQSWAMGAMVEVLGILPSGIPTDGGGTALSWGLVRACALSAALCLLGTWATGKWFSRREAP